MATTPRGQVQTQGSTPLADTVSGAPGTVTGTERSKLQAILAGASRLVTAALDGLMSAADKVKLDGIQAGAQVNPPYSVAVAGNQLLQRDANGDGFVRYINGSIYTGPGESVTPTALIGVYEGGGTYLHPINPAYVIVGAATNAANANALASGTADGDKLHNVGSTASAEMSTATLAANSTVQTLVTLAVPAGGTWAVFGTYGAACGASPPYTCEVAVVGGGQSAMASHPFYNATSEAAGAVGPIFVPGGTTVNLIGLGNTGVTWYRDWGVLNGTQKAQFLRAVRVA